MRERWRLRPLDKFVPDGQTEWLPELLTEPKTNTRVCVFASCECWSQMHPLSKEFIVKGTDQLLRFASGPAGLALAWPIRGQYLGHVIYIDQSEASIWVTWSTLTNHRPVFRSRDLHWPIIGQYSLWPGHWTTGSVYSLITPAWPCQHSWGLGSNREKGRG